MFFKRKEIPKPKRPELSLYHEIILHRLGHIGITELTDEALNKIINFCYEELVKKA